ncbi:ATP-dependent helicase rhp16-like, partial [Trifolium medium]|nr:ATP-dependent helicase rhp16-like [Trifolium medium]
MILLKNKILKSIVLRRTKIGRAADLALPPRIVSLRRDSLDIKEQDYYESLYNESQSQFNTYVEANTLTNNYAHIFDLLTRLRQAVDHPYLVVYSPTAAALKGENLASNGEQECGLCHDTVEDPVVTSCQHTFCKGCLIDFSASLGRVSCPSCSKLLTVDLTSNNDAVVNKTTIKGFRSSSILNRIQIENFQTSTKIEAL